MNHNARICIIGAGVSGLATAHYLEKIGYKNVTVLEAENRVGGKCCSIEYNGKVYELGSILFFDHNYHMMDLIEEYNITNFGPILYRGYFDENGKVISQIDNEEMGEFRRQFYRLPNILKPYEHIWEPGLVDIPKELCIPFSEWCIKNEIPLVQKAYIPPFTAFGYGFFEEIAAIYVLKYLDFQILNSFIEVIHQMTLVDGLQSLWEKVASSLEDVRLNTKVQSIKRNDQITIETNLDTLEFDKLIIACPLDKSLKFLDVSKEESYLFSQIEYNDFYVFAYKLDNIPEVCGYIPINFSLDRLGHLTVWYYRWADVAHNDLVTVYAVDKGTQTTRQIKEKVEEDLKKLGITNKGLYTFKKWKHFPHVSCEQLNKGYFNRLNNIQGVNNTYYTGELLSFSIMEECIAYSKALIEKYF